MINNNPVSEIELYKEEVISIMKELKFIKRNTKSKYNSLINSMCILQLYSSWEGFIFNTLETIKNYIRNEVIDRDVLNKQLYVLSINDYLKRISGSPNFEKKVNVMREIKELQSNVINFPLTNTKANVSSKVLNQLFYVVGINNIVNSIGDDMRTMDKYLIIRGKLAHGKEAITIRDAQVTEYSNTIVEVIDSVILKVYEYIDDDSYMKS